MDIIESFEKANHIPIPYIIDPRRPGDIDEYYSDPQKANEELHWKAMRTLTDMCADSWNWQTKNPAGYIS